MMRKGLEGCMTNLPPSRLPLHTSSDLNPHRSLIVDTPVRQDAQGGLAGIPSNQQRDRRRASQNHLTSPDTPQKMPEQEPHPTSTDIEAHENSILQQIQSIARNLSSHAPDIIQHATQQHMKWTLVDECPFVNLVKVHNIYMDAEATFHPGPDLFALRDVFWKLVIAPLAELFRYPKTKTHIFWENKKTIPFNREGILYFNVWYFDVLHHKKPSLSVQDVLACWFVTFVHECAHKVERGHGKDHEFAMEVLIQNCLLGFVELCVRT